MTAQTQNGKIIVTQWPNLVGDARDERVYDPSTIAQLVAVTAVAETKAELPLIKLARFGDELSEKGSLRWNGNVVEVFGIECDYDDGEMAFEEATRRLEDAGIFSLVYTTPSHTVEAPRWRVLAPFSRGYTDRMADRRNAAIGVIEAVLGIEFARESRTLSQAFYIGRVFDVDYRYRVLDGRFVDEGLVLPEERPPAPVTSPVFETASDEVEELLSYVSPDVGYREWVDIGMGVHQKYAGSEEGLAVWERWSSGGSKYRQGECQRKWRGFCGNGVTFGTVAIMARDAGADLSAIARKFKKKDDWLEAPMKQKDKTGAELAALATAYVEEQDDKLLPHVTTMTRDRVRAKPARREVIAGYFPVESTTAVVAMGGVGKTTWVVRKALELDPGIEVMIVSAEDGEADYQAKIYATVFSDYHKVELDQIDGKIHVMNLKGRGAKLITEQGGSFVPSLLVNDLVRTIRENYPKVRVVMFETVSRFAGGEDNERMEAIVAACDAVAIGINGACGLVHHMGKSQGREKVIDLYSGRGGSALGDNTRSMIVLTRLDDDYMGEKPIAVDPDDISAGKVFEVYHVRNSYADTQPPEYYVIRSGEGPVLEPLEIADEKTLLKHKLQAIERTSNAAATRVHDIIKTKGGKVPRRFFEANTQELIGLNQKAGRDLIDEMIDVGSLVEYEEKNGRAKPKFIKIGRVNANSLSDD